MNGFKPWTVDMVAQQNPGAVELQGRSPLKQLPSWFHTDRPVRCSSLFRQKRTLRSKLNMTRTDVHGSGPLTCPGCLQLLAPFCRRATGFCCAADGEQLTASAPLLSQRCRPAHPADCGTFSVWHRAAD